MKLLWKSVLIGLIFIPTTIFAGEANVTNVAVQHQQGSYSFSVTLAHNDEGWDHYANRWEVVAPDGEILATRVLHHPHVNEQPFTRGLNRVTIDPKIKTVTIRAHDLVHGYGGKEIKVILPE